MLNIVDGKVRAMDVMRFAVKFAVAEDARRSRLAGNSLTNDSHGMACAQAICPVCEVEIAAVCTGVSIS